MKLIQLRESEVECIEVPDSVKDRSCKGAIHLMKLNAKKITDEEFAYIEKEYPHVAKSCVVIDVVKKKAKPVIDAKPKVSKPEIKFEVKDEKDKKKKDK